MKKSNLEVRGLKSQAAVDKYTNGNKVDPTNYFALLLGTLIKLYQTYKVNY